MKSLTLEKGLHLDHVNTRTDTYGTCKPHPRLRFGLHIWNKNIQKIDNLDSRIPIFLTKSIRFPPVDGDSQMVFLAHHMLQNVLQIHI